MVEALLREDLTGLARGAWAKHGVTPADLFARLTPSQFVLLFEKPRGGEALDRVAALQSHNDARGRRGLKPVVPPWL